jgi:hypothetical protein
VQIATPTASSRSILDFFLGRTHLNHRTLVLFVAALSKILTDYETKDKRHIRGVGIETDPVTMKAIQDGDPGGTVSQNLCRHDYLSLLALKYISEGWERLPGVCNNAGIDMVTEANLTTDNDLTKVTDQTKADITKKDLFCSDLEGGRYAHSGHTVHH